MKISEKLKLSPFILTALFFIATSLYILKGDVFFFTFFRIAPISGLVLFWIGKTAYCIYWKMQCFMPTIPFAIGWLNNAGLITDEQMLPYLIMVLVIIICSIINAIKVFLR